MSPPGFPWDEALGLALGVLGWPPDLAWRATPRELALAARGRLGPGPAPAATSADLRRLMQAFPDGAP